MPLKGVNIANMTRIVIREILKILGKATLLTAIIGALIGILGYVKEWNSSIAYSNAFFIAGTLMIIAGASSRYAAGQGWNSYLLANGESFRDMSSSERANYIVEASSTLSTVILGVLTGILLIILSAIAAYLL